MKPKVSIVVPSYTNTNGLRECLASITKYTDLTNLEIIVVANGAATEARDIYLEFPVTLLWFDEPLGYTRAANEGLRVAQGEFIVLLNDDCVFTDQPINDWLDKLSAPFTDPKVGITGPLMLHCPHADEQFLVFFCVMIRRAMLDEIGMLDEVFSPGYGEDTDLCIRARQAGWKVLQVPSPEPATLVDKGCEDLPEWKRDKMWTANFHIYHDGNQTFGKEPEKYEVVLRRNSAILAERYRRVDIERAKGIDGWFNEDEMEWIARQVKGLPEGATVIEIGSWRGRSSRAIADNLPPHAKLYCVDTWNGSSGEPDAHVTAKSREGDDAYMAFYHNLHDHLDSGRVVAVRMTSEHAAETLSNLEADLIFIDGDHSAVGIKTDVEAWLPRLKYGGLLCGHDYYKENEGPYWVHVRQFVEERFPKVEKAATSIWWVRPHDLTTPKVYDAFIFFNELDLLEIRLETLWDVADKFVLVEATTTHAGHPKPLYFDENRERFSKYLSKINHVIVDLPDGEGSVYDKAWARERAQRNAILIGLQECAPHDTIIIGDADEIPNPEVLKNLQPTTITRLKQRMFYYYLNCENKEGWDWQKVAPYRLVKELTPCGIRYPPAGETPIIENAGWHFSFCGNAKHVSEKVQQYSHQEFNRPEITNLDHVRDCMAQGVDLYGRDLKYEFVEVDRSYPQYVNDNWATYVAKGLIKDRRSAESMTELAGNKLPSEIQQSLTITACVSTKDRYFTTLPLTIAAVAAQTHKPDLLVVYDDGEQRDLREVSPFNGLLHLLDEVGIKWEVRFGARQGQVANHQHCLDSATTDLVWRVDDDEIPQPDCLENLLKEMKDGVGAVGGLVHHAGQVSTPPDFVDGTLNDVHAGVNLSWYSWNDGPRPVEHLYSTFLYRVSAAREAGGYPKHLSPVGHREETIFSHAIHRAGYKLLVTPHAKTFHLREGQGGIRSFTDHSLWEHDEAVFQSYLKTWGLASKDTKVICLDCGLGDHFAFRSVLPQIRERNEGKELVLAVCYPEVFKDDGLKLISIADARLILGDKWDANHFYKHCWDVNNTKPIHEAMLEFWG